MPNQKKRRPFRPKPRREREQISATMKAFHQRRKKALALLERAESELVIVLTPEELAR